MENGLMTPKFITSLFLHKIDYMAYLNCEVITELFYFIQFPSVEVIFFCMDVTFGGFAAFRVVKWSNLFTWLVVCNAVHEIWLYRCKKHLASNSINFWGITACSLVEIDRRFGGTYCLLCLLIFSLGYSWFWRWRQYDPPKRLWSTELDGVLSQKVVGLLLIVTSVRPSEPVF
jgi:hypothetical protein